MTLMSISKGRYGGEIVGHESFRERSSSEFG